MENLQPCQAPHGTPASKCLFLRFVELFLTGSSLNPEKKLCENFQSILHVRSYQEEEMFYYDLK